MIPRGKLVAIAGERPVVSEASDGVKAVFLGSAPFTSDTADEERFLDPVGWVGGARVDADTANRYADLDRIFNAYQGDVPALAESRFWYHAEVFTATRLRGLLAPPQPDGNFQKFLKLTDPALVCYYLFFPGHVEPLEGCPDSDLASVGRAAPGHGAVSPSCSTATPVRASTSRP